MQDGPALRTRCGRGGGRLWGDMRFQLAIIITAAGRGLRAGGGLPKQWRMLAGRPALAHAIAGFAPHGPITLVVHPDDMPRAIEAFAGQVTLVAGAETRAGSVRAGLEAVAGTGATHVLIHDGARPSVSATLIEGVLAALREGADGAAPGLAVTDALWRVTETRVTRLASRDGLFRAQTPQGFRLAPILAAHRAPGAESAADDVALGLAAGLDIVVTPGDEGNIKLTWPEDFARAEQLLRQQDRGCDMRIGNGFDVHAFGPGDHVVLCGVEIPFGQGLAGHSDADVGMHALTDAIYGALAEGDIGRHFPPSDPQWKGADSRIFLAHAAARIRARGLRLGNADVTLICEAPKIGPHAEAMAAALAEVLGVEAGRVSVKATTSERLGFTGRGEGIAALASVLLLEA